MEGNKTILVVDDNIGNIDVLLNILKDYDVVTALDGKTALDIVDKEKIDLILLDIMMPQMDGFEVCQKIKEKTELSKIPVIFLSAKDQIDDIKKGFELGAVDYVTKPFNPIELLSRIKTHINLRSYEMELEKRVLEELEKNRLQEQIIFQQSKQAEMGELLMHISHQWKQPLSELGSINMYNIATLKHKSDISKEELLESFDKNTKILKFMSDTIDSFREFYIPNNLDEEFEIVQAINIARGILNATFDYNDIKIDLKIKKNATAFGNINEYSQIVLAILNNAKDICILRDIKNRDIKITIDKNHQNRSIVTIKDNCGGIRLENRDDIFLPFVSSKNSSGIGLYMAKTIIEKYNGTITVQNNNNGAQFTITL